MSAEITLKSVGSVLGKNEQKYIKVDGDFIPALKGLENFSHAIIIWWGHHPSQNLRNTLISENPYVDGPESLGVFATRSQFRPNPILITTVTITKLDEKNGIIEFSFIDAAVGSPVLDIKPYLPCADRVNKATTAPWCSSWPDCYEDSAHFDWSSSMVFN